MHVAILMHSKLISFCQRIYQYLISVFFGLLSFYTFFRGGENEVAINLIVQHVQTQLTARGFKLRYSWTRADPADIKGIQTQV